MVYKIKWVIDLVSFFYNTTETVAEGLIERKYSLSILGDRPKTGKIAFRVLFFVMSFIVGVNLSFGEQQQPITDLHVSPLKEQLYDGSSNMLHGQFSGQQNTQKDKNAITFDGTDDKKTLKTTFTLWQLPNQINSQMMSYIIKTVNGKIIVIDGGTSGDAPYLKQCIRELGNTVDVWFVTHPHYDHMTALREILKNPEKIKIGEIYGSFNDAEWVNKYANSDEQIYYAEFMKVLDQMGRKITELNLGQLFTVDGLSIEVLGIKNPEITANAINNSSVVLRVWDKQKSILFLSDLGVEAEPKLLKGKYADRLKCDYVQMAHHGQCGVSEEFYKRVNPVYCLWPTPKWLWENDNGGGKNSGPWKTLEVRKWMDDLKVKKHYCMFNGLIRIE